MAVGQTEDGEKDPNNKDIAAEDPESYFSTRRLRTIHDARDRAREVRSAVRDPSNKLNEDTANRYYRVEVDNYLSEIEPLAQQVVDKEDANETLVRYWNEEPLGEVIVHPPDSVLEKMNDDDVIVVGDPSLDPKKRPLFGLSAYLNAPEMYGDEFTIHIRKRHTGVEPFTRPGVAEIPTAVSHKAFRTANLFLAEIGLHVEVEESEHRAVITEELMEEVEKWRQQNIQ